MSDRGQRKPKQFRLGPSALAELSYLKGVYPGVSESDLLNMAISDYAFRKRQERGDSVDAPPPVVESPYYTIPEIAALWGVSIQTVRNTVRAAGLDPVSNESHGYSYHKNEIEMLEPPKARAKRSGKLREEPVPA